MMICAAVQARVSSSALAAMSSPFAIASATPSASGYNSTASARPSLVNAPPKLPPQASSAIPTARSATSIATLSRLGATEIEDCPGGLRSVGDHYASRRLDEDRRASAPRGRAKPVDATARTTECRAVARPPARSLRVAGVEPDGSEDRRERGIGEQLGLVCQRESTSAPAGSEIIRAATASPLRCSDHVEPARTMGASASTAATATASGAVRRITAARSR